MLDKVATRPELDDFACLRTVDRVSEAVAG
jgi:hypothetical protein